MYRKEKKTMELKKDNENFFKEKRGSCRKTIPFFSASGKEYMENTQGFHFAVGSILGDGSVNRSNFTLDFEQRSARFLFWKRQICLDTGLLNKEKEGRFKKTLTLAKGAIVINVPFTWRGKLMRNGPKKTPVFRRSWGFSTKALFYDPRWRELFYKPVEDTSKRSRFGKRIPKEIKDYFWGDLALAVFYLDDGWYDWQKRTVSLSTGELSLEESQLLADCLKENFGCEVKIYESRGKPHHLFVKRTSYPEFFRRVSPYVLDLARKHPRYALNKAMKNKVLPEPVPVKIGRPRKYQKS